MNFNNYFLKSFRVLLLPFSILIGLFIKLKNWLYDKEKIKSIEFNLPIICVGNLVVGGTGKTPTVEYLIRLLKDKYKIATISRGYKRKSNGFIIANNKTDALEIGDEPYLFYYKYSDQIITVSENRILAIPALLQEHPNIEAIILDDAFQHRSIKAGFNIILTEYGNLYINDYYIPTGELRDEVKSAKRAQIILVTKCPKDISKEKIFYITQQLDILPTQFLFFTYIEYGTPYHLIKKTETYQLNQQVEILLVFGIANPKNLKEYILQNCNTYYQLDYSDHHIFSSTDLSDIIEKYKNIQSEKKIILTTEKDAVRLLKFKNELEHLPIFVLPIEHKFIKQTEIKFNDLVIEYIQQTIHNQAV